jgi:hypothetical protein
MAGGPTEGPKPTIPAAAIVTVAGEDNGFKPSDLSRFIMIYRPYRLVHTDKDHRPELHD